ncbi:DUF484 family protein [Vibrio tetraodonis]|uniref:DUF484 family protein n=1 Tax=Vibrio tetraodonis TaxID=2231647 RepID=UPI000E0BE09C|nr:DUF484 family protein [Vibrio tetraodonis]
MSQVELEGLTAEVVADYLRDHPEFFIGRSGLIDRLVLPHNESGTVSLAHLQMQRQRQRIEELEEEITALMSLAKSNDRTFHEFMALEEQILKCDSMVSVIEVVEETAKSMGLVAYFRLLDVPSTHYSLNKTEYQGFATSHLNGKSAYLGRLRKTDRIRLLGDGIQAPEMGSYVILPLKNKSLQGIIAFSSSDGGHFQPNMDTLFLRHLALVLSHLIYTLPWKNEAYEATNHSSS